MEVTGGEVTLEILLGEEEVEVSQRNICIYKSSFPISYRTLGL